MGGRGHLRYAFQELDILGAAAELEISQQAGERFAAGYAEFLLIDLLEHLALVELGDALEVAEDFLLGAIENLDLEVDARSEEHTSELQSLRHLVCRLLLEKKK